DAFSANSARAGCFRELHAKRFSDTTSPMPTVEFLDAGKKIECGQYANLRKVALLHGVEVYKGVNQIANCRGNGLCGTCVMEIVEGLDNLSPKTFREQ